MQKKEILILIALFVIVILIVLLINYARGNNNYNEETMRCIAGKSKMVVSPTCSACAYQREILKGYLSYFEFVNINQEILEQYDIQGVPTWIINERKYEGVMTIQELKEITGC